MKTKHCKTWTKVKWPFNDAEPYASWECWQLGKVILHPGQWPKDGWSYVASYGATSDRSHSGFLPGSVTLDSAKAEIERLFSVGRFN